MTLAACGSAGDKAPESSGSGAPKANEVVLLTHDSFTLPKAVLAEFTKESGYTVKIRHAGDGGELTSKVALDSGNPDGDAVFGLDNTYGSRALASGALETYTPKSLPAGVAAYNLPGDTDHALTPVDNASVCVNVDTGWFAQHHLAAPATLDDLKKPAYKNLTVAPGAATSSPGLAFLLATIGKYGENGWQGYWSALVKNGIKIDDGWDEAYYTDFTQGGGKGTRPIVVSYDSSPAFTVKSGKTTTKALLDTCFRQVEYAGVLKGADNEKGAQALVDFLLTNPVQQALPTSMYVYPVTSAPVPKAWSTFAQKPTAPITVDPAQIDKKREDWLSSWSDLIAK
ncbi:MAG: thiamine ABC transporter substrate-binding protein [Nocardioides sp.]|nr:thiamine ABC transporter substrate-binding protein [Nocardioides sp.]